MTVTTALAILLAACGGGDTQPGVGEPGADAGSRERALAVTTNPDGWVAITPPTDALLQNLSIPADAPARGMWSGVGAWPMVGLHQAVLPDGKVLTWGTTPDGKAQNGRYFDLWDPNRGLFDAAAHQLTYDPSRQDSFCAPSVYLSDGRLMITGGNGNVSSQLYTPSTNSYARGANVADSRWYATMVTLPDGRPIMLGGINPYTEGQWADPGQAVARGLSSMTPEVLENGAWRSLFGAQSRTAFGPDFLRASLPKAWVAPDGRVFGIGTEQMYYVDPNANGGNGALTLAGTYKTPPNPNVTNDTAPNVGPTMSGVMYAPGKVLTAGGNAYHNGSRYPASRKATSIDLNGGGAVLTELPPMNFPRNFANLIALPDGRVLATGGETAANNDPALGVYAAEQWDPNLNRWSTLASAAVFRGYHSQTALLTNGAVLSTGGGNPGPVQLKGEVFYPPYLFRTVNGSAQLAPRPQMVGISGLSHANGATLQLDMASDAPIAQLVLIGLSSGTHSFNNGQRRIPLSFVQADIRVSASLPGNTLAPPGYYQVIAVDNAGVPSRGTIIALGQGVRTPPVAVTPYNPPVLDDAIRAPVITAGSSAGYTVSGSAGVTYTWDFGDGSPNVVSVGTASTTHTYAAPGLYGVTLTARATGGSTSTRSFFQAVAATPTPGVPSASGAMALEPRSGASARLWVANPDSDTVTAIDTATNTRVAEVAVGTSPRSVAIAPDRRVWIVNKGSANISILNPSTLAVANTVALPRASQPHGLVFAPGGSAFVVLEATGQLLKLDPATGAMQAAVSVGANPRHLSVTADGRRLLVSRFITKPLPGESTATIDTRSAGAEVLAVDSASMALTKTIVLRHSDKVDNEVQGSGIPNYLAAAAISPDGTSAWVPSKQDNVKRGVLRNRQDLDFQNSVRAISSRIDLGTLAEDYPRRIDHDNSSLGSAAVYHPTGAYLFVALETSRQVAVVDPVGGRELAKFDVGRAPQGVSVSRDGLTLYVHNYMDRTVSVLDLTSLVTQGRLSLPTLAQVGTVGRERLAADVLQGKQMFYDARDPRLARDSYMSCAACHSDAGHDGRTWDFTGFGEGLRNTPALKGRGGMSHGSVHWSANFDEIQDFEGQIRAFAGGTGLMTDAQFNAGTRNTPLGDRKAGISADLDALAAYLTSLDTFDESPNLNADGTLTAAAVAGRAVFANAACASCHGGANFTASSDASALRNTGTLKSTSGRRLGATLTGIDIPTLRDVWKTAPYLHDGSAPTLAAAVRAHAGNTLAGNDLSHVVAYLQQIGSQASANGTWSFNEGSGTTAADSSGGNRPLTLANTSWVTGKLGRAAQFDGASSHGTTNASVLDTNRSFSVSTWVRMDALTGWRTVVNQDGLNVSGFWLQYSGYVGSKFLLTLHDADSTASAPYRAIGTTTPVTGTWYHLVGVRDKAAGTLKLYVNGKLEGTTAYAGGWTANGSLNVGRGKWGGQNDWFAGAIDELRTFGTALSDADVAQLYAQGSNVAPTVSLTWRASGASGTQGNAITLSATAADSDGTVARVDFLDGGTLIGTATAAPWSMTWNNAAVGTHSLSARATDNAGASTESASVSVRVVAAANLPPSGAVTCAAEGGNCVLPDGATATVWYGANSGWVSRAGVIGSVACTNNMFTDPLVGTGKACRYVVTSTAPPANATACANEGQSCALPSGRTATVWYGASGSWAARTGVSRRIACTNAVFGDPLVGTIKACRYLVMP